MTISEKKIPIESTNPEFINVARIPDAAPRWLTGAAPIIIEAFGAENAPVPMPLRRRMTAKIGYGKFTGMTIKTMKVPAVTVIPSVVSHFGPNRSEIIPAAGPATRKPMLKGIK